MSSLLLRLATAFCLCACLPASAAVVTWNLLGVTFNDGGTASGSFAFDADTYGLYSINITTSGGALAGATYTGAGSYITPGELTFTTNVPFGPALYLNTGPYLTNAGGVEVLDSSSAEGTCDADPCAGLTKLRFASGSVVSGSPVPEPGTWLSMVSVLGAVTLVRRFRRTA